MKAAKDGAIMRKRNGIVIIDPKKAVGQKQIVDACPYGAIFWNERKTCPRMHPCAHRMMRGKSLAVCRPVPAAASPSGTLMTQ